VLTAKPGCTSGAATVLPAGDEIAFAVFNTKRQYNYCTT